MNIFVINIDFKTWIYIEKSINYLQMTKFTSEVKEYFNWVLVSFTDLEFGK